jgi:hypothetical protein
MRFPRDYWAHLLWGAVALWIGYEIVSSALEASLDGFIYGLGLTIAIGVPTLGLMWLLYWFFRD